MVEDRNLTEILSEISTTHGHEPQACHMMQRMKALVMLQEQEVQGSPRCDTTLTFSC